MNVDPNPDATELVTESDCKRRAQKKRQGSYGAACVEGAAVD